MSRLRWGVAGLFSDALALHSVGLIGDAELLAIAEAVDPPAEPPQIIDESGLGVIH